MRTDCFVETVFASTSSVTAVTPSPVSGKVGVKPFPIRHPKRKNYPHKLKSPTVYPALKNALFAVLGSEDTISATRSPEMITMPLST